MRKCNERFAPTGAAVDVVVIEACAEKCVHVLSKKSHLRFVAAISDQPRPASQVGDLRCQKMYTDHQLEVLQSNSEQPTCYISANNRHRTTIC